VNIDRKAQKQSWLSDYFNSPALKLLGIGVMLVLLLSGLYITCLCLDKDAQADKVWSLLHTLSLMLFGAMFSTISIKVKTNLKS